MVLAPSDDRHLAGEERRIANDGRLYTFPDFLDHYGESTGRVKWNAASDDTHLAGDGDAGGAAHGGASSWLGYPPPPDEPQSGQEDAAGNPVSVESIADAGWQSKSIAKRLIKDERLPLECDDLTLAAEVFETPIIIGSNFPADSPPNDGKWACTSCKSGGYANPTWHIWYEETEWTVTEFSTVPLCQVHPRLRFRECAIMHLSHHRGIELIVMFVKVLRGIAAADDTL